jgi:hypothetical protein
MGNTESAADTSYTCEIGLAEAVLRECLSSFPYIRMQVSGTCMTPELSPGDFVRITSPTRRRLRWGDIVLVRSPDGVRLHRLVFGWPGIANPSRGFIVTKADRCVEFDQPVPCGFLLGTVTRVEGRVRERAQRGRRRWRTLESLLEGLMTWARYQLRSGEVLQ